MWGTRQTTGLDPAIASALRTITTERAGLDELAAAIGNGLGEAFGAATRLIGAAKGRVIVTGMGKSGHVGRKIAATLASTGTPAYFVHPGEASHGDLGMVHPDDVIVALSWTGESRELADLISYSRRFRVGLIAITSNATSALGEAADVCLTLPRAGEACPNGVAPTTSTTMQLVLGDALAVALLELRGFTAADFRVFHPGGKLGAQLTFVDQVMHTGERLPLVRTGTSMGETLLAMTAKGFGCAIVVDEAGRLSGIVTDGDLRRHMCADLTSLQVEAVMTAEPQTIPPDTLAVEALERMEAKKRTTIIVVADGRPVGLVHIHDLLRLGVT